MTSKKEIKKIASQIASKKIGNDAIKKINSILKDKVKDIIQSASRKADFAGRKVIKKEDLQRET